MRALWAILLCAATGVCAAAEPVVRFERGDAEVRIFVGDAPFARYVSRDPKILRPYFTDVRALDGTPITRHHPPRAGIDATDHDTMHPGIWLAFGDLNGADFWRNKGRVEQVGLDIAAGGESIVVRNRYLDGETVVCDETQTVTVVARDGAAYLLIDSTFAGEKPFYFGDQEEMGLGVRVATPLAVKNGGRIVNSAGQRNEAECWGKTALWADYAGTIEGTRAGVVLMPHPENFRPSWFHARDYGFIAANPFGRKAFTEGEASRVEVQPGETLRLRYGVCVYTGQRGGADAYRTYLALAGEGGEGAERTETSEKIRQALEEIVSVRKVPGMVAAIADSRGVIASGAAGVLKYGAEPRMTVDDRVHIGSCTKAMTSTVLATLVAEGALRWDSRLVEVVPSLKDAIHPEYHTATLWELVSHRARFPANAANWWAHATMELKARRLQMLRDSLREAPVPPKGGYLYSNLGYVAAGCVAEAVTGETWETLIRERLFEPLGMTSAGFGPPGTPGQIDQPWGHVKEGSDWRPMQFDNAEALGPAGRVHCTLADWAKFVALQLPARAPRILERAQLDRLIVPDGNYAAGWGVVERDWAGGTALSHSGSNTMWYATVWAAPARDRVYLVAMNAAGDDAAMICDGVIGRLIELDQTAANAE